jgi:Virulence factor BrkB
VLHRCESPGELLSGRAANESKYANEAPQKLRKSLEIVVPARVHECNGEARPGGSLMRFFFRVLYDAIMRFSQDDGWAIASHIALSILTSLFPFLIFVTALASFFGSKSLADEVHELVHVLLQTWPPQVATPIANEIHNVLTQSRSGLLTISVILAIYFSSSGVEAVRTGLNRAYDVRDPRPWWLLRLEQDIRSRWAQCRGRRVRDDYMSDF